MLLKRCWALGIPASYCPGHLWSSSVFVVYVRSCARCSGTMSGGSVPVLQTRAASLAEPSVI